MATEITKSDDVEDRDVMVIDQRNLKKRSTWTALVQLARRPQEKEEKNVALESSNYVSNQTHDPNKMALPLPNSTTGTIRVNISIQTATNNIDRVLKTEVFSKQRINKRSGGGSRGMSRGAR